MGKIIGHGVEYFSHFWSKLNFSLVKTPFRRSEDNFDGFFPCILRNENLCIFKIGEIFNSVRKNDF